MIKPVIASRRIMLLGILAVTLACSRDLSREAAFDLIVAHERFATNIDVVIPVGSFWHDWRSINDHPIGKLTAAEQLTLRTIGSRQGWWWQQYQTELTPSGQARAARWTQLAGDEATEALKPFEYNRTAPEAVAYKILLAERRLNEVIGIGIVNENQRQADFSWQWVPTEDGNALPERLPSTQIYNGFALCQRYDDGWRIVHLELHN